MRLLGLSTFYLNLATRHAVSDLSGSRMPLWIKKAFRKPKKRLSVLSNRLSRGEVARIGSCCDRSPNSQAHSRIELILEFHSVRLPHQGVQ
jgi:hypothetical protein